MKLFKKKNNSVIELFFVNKQKNQQGNLKKKLFCEQGQKLTFYDYTHIEQLLPRKIISWPNEQQDKKSPVIQFYNRLYSTMIQKETQPVPRVKPSQMVASFLLKTYEILERKQFDHIVCWDTDNVGFIIRNVIEFSKEILPKYFRHNNFSSFVRQLNMYDFHKIKQTNDCMVFKNNYFKKDGYNLLKQIKRKAPKRNECERKVSQSQTMRHNGQRRDKKNKKEVKATMEAEIVSSSNLFQKSIKLLESQKQEIRKSYNYIHAIHNTQHTQSNSYSLLQNIYSLKQICFKIFEKYEDYHKSADEFYQSKCNLYQKLCEQINIKESPPKTSIRLPITNGFQPYSQKFIKLQSEQVKIISSNSLEDK